MRRFRGKRRRGKRKRGDSQGRESALSPKIASPLSPKEGLMLWLNLCEVWRESCNAPRRPQLRIPAVQESVQSLVWSTNEMGSHWRDSNTGYPKCRPFCLPWTLMFTDLTRGRYFPKGVNTQARRSNVTQCPRQFPLRQSNYWATAA